MAGYYWLHTIAAWGPMAERGEKDIKKGNLYVEGKIRTRSWEDKDGNKRYATEVISEYYQNLSPRNITREKALSNSAEENVDFSKLSSSEDNLPVLIVNLNIKILT